ncbi:MAG: beta strand repeat-containing protein, partial [Archangium sp.]
TTFTEAISGLAQCTTYYFCAGATNAVGTTFGPVQTFTTPSAPTVVTMAATSVVTSSATLNSTVNPNGLSTTAVFRFSTVPGTCSTTFGAARPTTAVSQGAGTAALNFSTSVTGLTGGTQYWYCVVATNSAGTTLGDVLTFITPGAPIVTTEPATMVGTTTATLNGTANPNQNASTGWFRYTTSFISTCNDTFGTRTPSSGGTSLGNGTTPVPYSQALTGLTSGATYYYCAIASNSSSTRFGPVLTFTTAAAPVVSTSAATLVTNTTVQLNGTANPRGSQGTAWFRYATTNPGTCNDTFGTRFPATGGDDVGAGSTAVAFNEALTGLDANTTYYFCALASNANGTAVGSELSFTTQDAPAVTTSAATSILAASATLNGTGDPNGAATTGWFRYSTTNPGTCDDAFGTRAPTSSGSSLGSGTTAASFSQSISGLTASTTYYYCAIASNTHGTRFGSVSSFTTGAGPLVTTLDADNITATSARLNANINPNAISTTAWFRYSATNPGSCSDSFGTRTPTSGGTAVGSGTAAVPNAATITGLMSGLTYYYCAIASNAAGTAFGAVMSFTTQGPPVVTTTAATAITASSALLGGTANPAGGVTTAWFRYATTSPTSCNDTFGTRAPSTGGTSIPAGFTAQPFTLTAGGLAPATTYYFCAIAQNSNGTRFGTVMSFTTAAGPAVTTSAATAVTSSTATLNGSANPRNLSTTGWYRYASTSPGSCNDSFGTRTPSTGGTDLGSGNAAIPYTQALTGLAAGTTYYFCAIAQNSAGTSFGTLEVFTTPGPPSVTTVAASTVGGTSAILNGTGVANLSAATGWFRYSTTNPTNCDDTFGTRAPASGAVSLGSGTTSTNFSQTLAGLSTGTTYYFCAIASNANGTRFGSVLSFTTPAAPVVVTNAATAVTANSATLNGAADPRLAATTGWFRYSTTNPTTCNDSFGTRTPSTGGTSLGSGSGSTPFTQALTGLTPGATYYYCAIASNSVGTSVGTVQTFSSSAVAPTVLTDTAIGISGNGATLRGSANPGGAATIGYFRYSGVNPGACNDTFGTRAPSSSGSALGSGNVSVPFQEVLTGLSPGATYYFCAIAQNASGTRFGSVEVFVTPNAPLVTTNAASNVTGMSAALNGSANPRLGAATGYFRYATTNPGTCNDTFGTRSPASGGTSLGAGMTSVAFTQTISNLTPATTYYFCAIASNVIGVGVGQVQQFRTPGAPIVVTSSAMVTGRSAVFSGAANPNGAATTGAFRYGTTQPTACDATFGTRAPVAGGSALGSGETSVPFTQTVNGLELGATYWFCAEAENSVGRGTGEVQSFMVAAPVPTVTTAEPSDVASRSATLHSLVVANGTAATAWFRYGTTAPTTCDDMYGTRVPEMGGLPAGSGNSLQVVELDISGLTPGTKYFVCAAASNTGGAAFGTVVEFTTLTEPPTVRTAPPTFGEAGEVIFTAYANTKAIQGGKGLFVVYDTPPIVCNPGLGRTYPGPGIDLPAKDSEEPFSFTATDIAPGQHYVCTQVSTNGGVATGEVIPFTVEEMATGCGCTSTSGLLPALLGLLALARRRRRS